MSTILIASLEPGEGRTAITAGLGARLASDGRAVRLLRIRSGEGADPAAEDDARTLAAVEGCTAPANAVSEQEVQAALADASPLHLVEAPAGSAKELADRLQAKVILVGARTGDLRLGDLAAAKSELGDSLLGVIVMREHERSLDAATAAVRERGLRCLGALPEDRMLAGPNVRELAEALRASRLVEQGEEEEALEFVMLGPISSDPGQPYFLQHPYKAVINRFDKMDLHLAALATEPECLVLTGGQQPSPYLLDRVAGSDLSITVLLSPENTVRTMELVDDLFPRTRFVGKRKRERAIELVEQHVDLAEITRGLD